MTPLRLRIKPYIQPFERELALREAAELTGQPVASIQLTDSEFWELPSSARTNRSQLAKRLTYWVSVSRGEATQVTRQAAREATTSVARNGVDLHELQEKLPFGATVPLPNRRCLRYGPHGIHEYRGKFFPQLVGALINISGVPRTATVADPMCGSGTAAVETVLSGRRALALDLNPLSVKMTAAKCALLACDPRALRASYEHLRDRLLPGGPAGRLVNSHFSTLSSDDQEYLRRWFAPEVLHSLDEVVAGIEQETEPVARQLFWTALSNILRRLSWQKDADLRVRREVRTHVDLDPTKEFLEELGRSLRAVLAFLFQEGSRPAGSWAVKQGDARRAGEAWVRHRGRIDLFITSPPYATALPYLDTDRLSLCYLGLAGRRAHRGLDAEMIGNREVSERRRQELWAAFELLAPGLPISVSSLVGQIAALNSHTETGFRRRNLAALLAKYFFDMRQVFAEMSKLGKRSSAAFVIVGNNHTVAGGEKITIRTAALLADCAEQVGWRLKEVWPMDMLSSRDLFRRNALSSEEIMWFEKAG